MFCDYFFTQLYRPSYVKQILDGVKNFNDSAETIRQFFTCIAKLLGTQWFCEIWKKLKEAR
jgi:hypothetical protein